jgi:serine/threonine-protein kinase
MALLGDAQLIGGKYRVLRLIGRGGMGQVYEVEHLHTGEHLALKLLMTPTGQNDQMVERFKREARASARIKSEHVVRITDADVAHEFDYAPFFLVMELLEGTDLDIATDGVPQAPATVVEWLRQIARGLDRAHALGIIHRDLKPENLFLTRREDGSPLVKILDFGIAKMMAEHGQATQTGQILGTPNFMAPEQVSGRGTAITPAADRWALGLIAYRFLTGEHYWNCQTVVQILSQIMYDPMPPPSTRSKLVDRGFDHWFATACNRDANKRFPSAMKQVELLAEAVGVPFRAIRSSEDIIDTGTPQLDALRPPVDPTLRSSTPAAASARRSSATGLSRPARQSLANGRTRIAVGGTIAAVAIAALIFGWTSMRKPTSVQSAQVASAQPSAAELAPMPSLPSLPSLPSATLVGTAAPGVESNTAPAKGATASVDSGSQESTPTRRQYGHSSPQPTPPKQAHTATAAPQPSATIAPRDPLGEQL